MMVVFQGFVLIVCVCALIVLVTLAFFAGCDLFETSDLFRRFLALLVAIPMVSYICYALLADLDLT
jgi:bacteriorhodopsin